MSDSSDAIILSAADDNAGSYCSEVGIVVAEEAEHLPSPELHRMHRRRIYVAAASGNWSEVASSTAKIHPHWWRVPLTRRGITALHVAVSMRKTSFVEKLVDCCCMNNIQDLEICMADGNTAFCLAAITGNVEIAEILLGKNPRLLWIRGQRDMLPIQIASSAGHIQMTQFLFQAREDLHNNVPFQDIVDLFFLTITNNIYTVTSKLLDRYPKLVTIENEEGLIPLQMLARCSLSKENNGDRDIASSLFKAMEEEKDPLNSEQLSKAVFDAAKSGNSMILEFLLKYHPDLLFEVDSKEQRTLLHIAILYRQETVYQLILSKGDSKNVLLQLVDFEGNNVLHLAGMLPQPEQRFGFSTNHLLMSKEEKWFQEVEKIVPPAMKTKRNNKDLSPKELFYKSHRELHKESMSGMKAEANTLVVVATLIITLGITGALSIPIKDIDSVLTPVFRKKTWYTLYFLAIEAGNYLCAASMMFYGAVILPIGWEPKDDYVHSRQRKLVFGNMTLYASLGLMFSAIVSGAILIYDFLSNWVFYFIAGLGCITLILPAHDVYKNYYPLAKGKKKKLKLN